MEITRNEQSSACDLQPTPSLAGRRAARHADLPIGGRGRAANDLSGKLGAARGRAAELLRHARKRSRKLGICFHVGAECMGPAAYRTASERAGGGIAKSEVKVDVVDVGGGFPVS